MRLQTLTLTFLAAATVLPAQTNYCWSQETGTHVREVAASYSTAWLIGTTPTGQGNYDVLRWTGYRDHFESVPGQAVKIAVDGYKTPWVLTAQMGIWRRNEKVSGGWERMPGAAREIAAGGREVWVIGDEGRIYRWNGTGWTQVPGTAKQLSISPEEVAYLVNSANELHRYDASANPPWVRVATGITYAAAGPTGRILAVTTNAATPYSLFENGTWKVISNGKGSKVAMESEAFLNAWMVDANGIVNRGQYSTKNCSGSIVGLGQ